MRLKTQFTNMEDGAPEIPVPVTQNQLQVAEGTNEVIQLQSRPALLMMILMGMEFLIFKIIVQMLLILINRIRWRWSWDVTDDSDHVDMEPS